MLRGDWNLWLVPTHAPGDLVRQQAEGVVVAPQHRGYIKVGTPAEAAHHLYPIRQGSTYCLAGCVQDRAHEGLEKAPTERRWQASPYQGFFLL